MRITNILYYLNQNLFSNCFKENDISYKELHPLSNEIFSFFIEKKFPNSFNDSEHTPEGHRRINSYSSAFGKLDIDELSISIHGGTDIKLEDKDQIKILSILYAIIFSHFIESQMKLKSSKDTIEILEDKIDEEITSKMTLQKELKHTLKEVENNKNKLVATAVRTIQRHWKRLNQNKRSKAILHERNLRIQMNQQRRRSGTTHLSAPSLKQEKSSSSDSVQNDFSKEVEQVFEQEQIENIIEEQKLTPNEEAEEFAEELNEEEIMYLQNTGRFFILDSMRQMDSLFSDLYHNFVENNFQRKDKGSIFDRLKSSHAKSIDSSLESD